MILYRIKHAKTRKFYRHKYSQFHGGDWVDAEQATVWSKVGGVNGALGSLREGRKKHPDFIVEKAEIHPSNLVWMP